MTSRQGSDNVFDIRLLTGRATVTLIYFFIAFLVYKFKFIDIKTIKELSKNSLAPIFLILTLLANVYMQYYFKNISYSASTLNALTNMASFIPAGIFILLVAKKLRERKDQDFAKKEPRLHAALHFTESMYKEDREIFKRKLKEIGIRTNLAGYQQLVHCLVILKACEPGKNINLNKDIYYYVAKFASIEINTVIRNCNNVIEDLWYNLKDEKLKLKISKRISSPSLGEFLNYIVENTTV